MDTTDQAPGRNAIFSKKIVPSRSARTKGLSKHERETKVLLVGDNGVGKTSLLRLLVQEAENLPCKAHIILNSIMSENGTPVPAKKVEVWDSVGGSHFRELTESCFRKVHGVALVYDVNNEQSFLSLSGWLDSLKPYCSGAQALALVLIANKTDLCQPNGWAVTSERGKHLADDLGIPLFETSTTDALGSVNVTKAFHSLVSISAAHIRLRPTAPAAFSFKSYLPNLKSSDRANKTEPLLSLVASQELSQKYDNLDKTPSPINALFSPRFSHLTFFDDTVSPKEDRDGNFDISQLDQTETTATTNSNNDVDSEVGNEQEQDCDHDSTVSFFRCDTPEMGPGERRIEVDVETDPKIVDSNAPKTTMPPVSKSRGLSDQKRMRLGRNYTSMLLTIILIVTVGLFFFAS
eukprot:gb/GEZN01007572.1/.p1 GENE.gb/GEZN01007572.1/~~gb/GEZN01007572.1/.p1  ORF type:complete len:406 (-),score=18.00 gb/GEZN01007572.1/:197-1414(-)